MLNKKTGQLIVIEGTDGSGKATQLNLLLNYLKKKQINYASFDFPQYGKTFFGDFAGRFLNGEFGHFSRINPYLASFPYAADRWQAKNKIWKAINDNQLVLCNRYTPSVVYQAVKVKPSQRKTFLKWVETLEYEVFNIPKPNLVIFLYVPLAYAQTLIAKKNKRAYLNGKAKDQYETDINYLKKVENMYLDFVKNNKNWVKIDGVENETILTPKAIHRKIVALLDKCGFLSARP
jgi:dTMP kinase